MLEENGQDFGVGTGALCLLVGIMSPIFFNAFTYGQGQAEFFIVLAGIGACLLYGEAYLTLPAGVSFAVGFLMTSFVHMNWWLVGVGVAAAVVSLAKNAAAEAKFGPGEDMTLDPWLS